MPDTALIVPATPAPAQVGRPTAEQIDELAELYFDAKAKCIDADAAFKEIEDVAIAFVRNFGIVPPKAENSHRLDGKYTVLTVIVANATAIDEQRVLELRDALAANKFDQVFPNLFSERTRHEQVKDAALAILAAGMPKRLTETVQKLFARCFSTNRKAPSLRVKRLVEKPAKQPRAKKSAQKGGE